MITKYQIDNLSEAVNNILLPKFDEYLETKKLALKSEVEAEVLHIEAIEDLVAEMTFNHDFSVTSDNRDNSIVIDGLYFRYDSITEEFKLSNNTLNMAKERVYEKNHLYSYWSTKNDIRTRIKAIISTLEPASFPDVVTIVSNMINFDEFINTSN